MNRRITQFQNKAEMSYVVNIIQMNQFLGYAMKKIVIRKHSFVINVNIMANIFHIHHFHIKNLEQYLKHLLVIINDYILDSQRS